MKTFELGYSPCPNDTFIFDALLHGKLQNIRGQGHKVTHECEASGLEFHERLEDVETLNYLALAGRLDITKVSFGVITEVLDNYCLLRSGGALGRGCGPLVSWQAPEGEIRTSGGRLHFHVSGCRCPACWQQL